MQAEYHSVSVFLLEFLSLLWAVEFPPVGLFASDNSELSTLNQFGFLSVFTYMWAV